MAADFSMRNLDVRLDDLKKPVERFAALLEPVEPGLHRAARHPERPGRTEHPDVRVVGEQLDEPCVEGVHPGLASHGHIVRVGAPRSKHRAQPDQPSRPPLHTVLGSRTVTG